MQGCALWKRKRLLPHQRNATRNQTVPMKVPNVTSQGKERTDTLTGTIGPFRIALIDPIARKLFGIETVTVMSRLTVSDSCKGMCGDVAARIVVALFVVVFRRTAIPSVTVGHSYSRVHCSLVRWQDAEDTRVGRASGLDRKGRQRRRHKRAFFTKTPMFWAIVVRACRQDPIATQDALRHWLQHEKDDGDQEHVNDDIARSLLGFLTGGDVDAAEEAPEVAEVQDGTTACAVGSVRERQESEAVDARPTKRKRHRCAFMSKLKDKRCTCNPTQCNTAAWATLTRYRGKVTNQRFFEDRRSEINRQRAACHVPLVPRLTEVDFETVLKSMGKEHLVCPCHPECVVDGKVVTRGLKHHDRPATTPSKGTAQARSERRLVQRIGDTSLVDDLIAEGDMWKARCEELKARVKSLEARVHKGFSYATVQHDPEYVWWHLCLLFCLVLKFDRPPTPYRSSPRFVVPRTDGGASIHTSVVAFTLTCTSTC